MKLFVRLQAARFDDDGVYRRLAAMNRRALMKAGAFVRQRARSSIRPGGKTRRLSDAEMSPDQRRAYWTDLAAWKAGGRNGPRPRRPVRAGSPRSVPGRPPRSHTGALRRYLLFAPVPGRGEVVVGAAWWPSAKGRGATGALEHGGPSRGAWGNVIQVAAFPFMGPALEQERPNFPGLWAGAFGG